MQWARAFAGRLFGWPVVDDGEDLVHELSSILRQTHHDDAVKVALVDAVRRLTGARTVRWVDPGETTAQGNASRELVLRAGQQTRGRLLIESRNNNPAEWNAATDRRLETVCTMAACALGYCDEQGDAETSSQRETSDSSFDHPGELTSGNGTEDSGRRAREFSTPVLQDATFLGAVLPFALGQARRHGEPITLLCVAVDRLNGIRELLGAEVADRAVRNVGKHFAAQLRSSDIIARVDDDRIIVALPRARIQGAMFVAQKICRSVEMTPSLLLELPCLTVSIGVAEYPGTADSVEGLVNAADAALSQAKAQGRNRAVAAPNRPTSDRLDRPSLAS